MQTWLKQRLGLTVQFDVRVDDDSKEAGMSFRAVSDKVEFIVFKFTDENLHHNSSDLAFIYNNTVRSLIRDDVRSVLRELPDNAMIFITSDHGFTPMPKGAITIPATVVVDNYDTKYRNARTRSALTGPKVKQVVTFAANKLGISTKSLAKTHQPIRYVLFPRPGYVFQRPTGQQEPDRYSHGGISLAECMIPMIVMSECQPVQRPLWIDSIQQMGASMEGEPLELEIVIAGRQPDLEDMSITLSFSRSEIAQRREVFSYPRKTYRIQWSPMISDAERGQEVIMQTVTVTLSYRQDHEVVRTSKSVDVRIKLEPGRLRRRQHANLDPVMGVLPKGLK